MKFYAFAIAMLLAVLGVLAVVTSDNNTSSASPSSGPDDSSMKTLKIE